MGKLVIIICVIVLAAISAVVFPKDKNDDKVVSSKDLHEKLNEERKAEGSTVFLRLTPDRQAQIHMRERISPGAVFLTFFIK